MSTATVAQFAKDPASFIEAVEHGQTIHLLRNGKRTARLSPVPAQKSAHAKLDSWIAREQPFLDSMNGKSHRKSAFRALEESRR